jgi:vacuolar-type H+-ATPase subunit I/STV1
MEFTMVKKLSEQLAALSVHAKNAEDAVAAAQKETQEKIAARRAAAHDSATKAVEKVKQSIQSVGNSATKDWNAVKAKVSADVDSLKARVAEHKQERDAKRAEKRAEELEDEAAFAIDYAVSSIEQARLAALDAIAGRLEADAAKAA